MNSNNIKDKYKEIYSDLFNSCDLVISIPTSLTLFGGTVSIFGGLILNQKISQRVYIGISKNNNDKISISSYKIIDYKTLNVVSVINDDFYKIGETFKHLLFQEYKSGFEIHIFCEFEWKDTDLVTAGIILGLDIITGRIDNTIFDLLKSGNFKELYNLDYFNNFLHKTLKLRLNYNDSTLGGSSLSSPLTSLVDTALPVLNMIEKRLNTPITKFSINRLKLEEELENNYVKYNTYKIDQLSGDILTKDIPYDFMIFSIGDYINANWFQSTVNWIDESINFKDLFIDKNYQNNSDYFLDKKDKDQIIYQNIDAIINYEFSVLKVFCDSLLHKEKIEKLFFFIERNIEAIKTLFGKQNIISHSVEKNNFGKISKLIKNIYPTITDDRFLIYTTSHSNDNKYIVLLPRELPKKDLTFLNNSLKEYIGEDCGLIYSTKHHGFEETGLKIEQFISNGIFSIHVGGTCILKEINGKTRIGMHEDLLSTYSGLIFDSVNNKIYINGRKVTSQELHSQTSTVEIFKFLTDNLNKEIENSKLPLSSYSKNKNEMITKIINPLDELINKELGNSLPVTCKGSLYDYYIIFKATDLNISILKKV